MSYCSNLNWHTLMLPMHDARQCPVWQLHSIDPNHSGRRSYRDIPSGWRRNPLDANAKESRSALILFPSDLSRPQFLNLPAQWHWIVIIDEYKGLAYR